MAGLLHLADAFGARQWLTGPDAPASVDFGGAASAPCEVLKCGRGD